MGVAPDIGHLYLLAGFGHGQHAERDHDPSVVAPSETRLRPFRPPADG
jgi:hypothetical protein